MNKVKKKERALSYIEYQLTYIEIMMELKKPQWMLKLIGWGSEKNKASSICPKSTYWLQRGK